MTPTKYGTTHKTCVVKGCPWVWYDELPGSKGVCSHHKREGTVHPKIVAPKTDSRGPSLDLTRKLGLPGIPLMRRKRRVKTWGNS